MKKKENIFINISALLFVFILSILCQNIIRMLNHFEIKKKKKKMIIMSLFGGLKYQVNLKVS